MSTWSRKERQWRDEFRTVLAEHGKTMEFKRKVDTLTDELLKVHKDRKYCDKLAQKKVAEEYADIFPPAEFNARWEAKLVQERVEKQISKPADHRERGRMARKKKEKDKIDNRVLSVKLDFDAASYAASDILADAKWVYANMARLLKTNPNGTQTLDASVLKEAPSSGAVGMAGYALQDQKAFFEKFVTRILPKEEEVKPDKTDEEKLRELDPTFEDLEKYLKRLTEMPDQQAETEKGEPQED